MFPAQSVRGNSGPARARASPPTAAGYRSGFQAHAAVEIRPIELDLGFLARGTPLDRPVAHEQRSQHGIVVAPLVIVDLELDIRLSQHPVRDGELHSMFGHGVLLAGVLRTISFGP